MRRRFNVCNVLFLQQCCRRRSGDHRTTVFVEYKCTTLDYFSRFNSCAISYVQCISPMIKIMSVLAVGHIAISIVLFYKIGTVITRFYPQSSYVLNSLFFECLFSSFLLFCLMAIYFFQNLFFSNKIFQE